MSDQTRCFYEQAERDRPDVSSPGFYSGHVLQLMEPVPGGVFVDVGCYDGSKTSIFAAHLGVTRTIGIDFLGSRLEEAGRRGIETISHDLNGERPLPLGDGIADVVFLGDVIEHVYSPDQLVGEIARILRPGGYLVLSTPNLACWKNRLCLLFGWQPFYTEVSTRKRYGNPRMPPGIPSGHIRLFVPRALADLLADFGLRVETVRGGHPTAPATGIIPWLITKIDGVVARASNTLSDELIVKARKRPSTGRNDVRA
jgi:SAM-dependent methyltransferase